jgi:uncharacterized protein
VEEESPGAPQAWLPDTGFLKMLDPKLLEILVCPKCRGDLKTREAPPALICENCKLVYEIRDGIPILLTDEARPLDSA